ncbi:MAG: Ig-like domain-containing protein [Blautia sp.]
MKRLRKCFVGLAVAVITLLFAGVSVFAAVKPASIAIKAEANQMAKGSVMELDSRIRPGNAKVRDRNIIWTSSDSKVIKVLETRDDDTKIKALKEGRATITVTVKGTQLKASKVITVVKKDTPSNVLAGIKSEISKCKRLIQSYQKKVAAMEPSGDPDTDYDTCRDMERKLDAVDERLEKAEDQLEDLYRAGSITRKTYRAYDKKLDALDDLLEETEEDLEYVFGDAYDD